MTGDMDRGWLASFPQLAGLGPDEARWLADSGRVVVISSGAVLYRPGDPCNSYMLVAEGRVRVQLVSRAGREIVLYRVGPGESCILATSCLMAGRDHGAEAIAETDIHAIAVPASDFHALLAESVGFRDFVFSTYGNRLVDLIHLVVDVAFHRVDVRLAQRLLSLRPEAPSPLVTATHQELAVELGTAREVVSRQLKEFERRGWVELQRGRIVLRDHAALADLSRQAAL